MLFRRSRQERCAALCAGYHYRSGGGRSGDYFAYDEVALRPGTAWLCVHLHRNHEVILPAGKELTLSVKVGGLLNAMTTEQIAESAGESGAASSGVALGQEATLAERSVVKDSWADRPDTVIRVHKAPRRRL